MDLGQHLVEVVIMTYATLTTYHFDSAANFGGVSAAVLLGSFPSGSAGAITGIEVEGAVNFVGYTASSPFEFTEYFAHGVAIIPHGATLVNVQTGADSQMWAFNKLLQPSPNGLFWSPSTNNAAVSDRYSFREKWRGQLAVGTAGWDVWYTNGNVNSGGVKWVVDLSGRIYYGNV